MYVLGGYRCGCSGTKGNNHVCPCIGAFWQGFSHCIVYSVLLYIPNSDDDTFVAILGEVFYRYSATQCSIRGVSMTREAHRLDGTCLYLVYS